MSFKNTPLYGGAITVDFPSNFADASLIRQIPDHQEVYLDNNGYTSIVVEILEYVDKSSDDEALQFHFGDLVEGTGDATTIVAQERESMEGIGNNPVLSLTFIQTPPPPTDPTPKRKTPEYTFIQLLLIRLKEHGTDHTPASEPGGETQLMRESKAMRQKVLESFTIKEWGLFEG
ncbi:mog1p -like protein [Stemphylium lycopersici]|nr:mog1p -like protein [Stemphylium lycopersici]